MIADWQAWISSSDSFLSNSLIYLIITSNKGATLPLIGLERE